MFSGGCKIAKSSLLEYVDNFQVSEACACVRAGVHVHAYPSVLSCVACEKKVLTGPRYSS